MLKKMRILSLGIAGAIAALCFLSLWSQGIKSHLILEERNKNSSTQEGFQKVLGLHKATLEHVKKVYQVLYFTKEKENREKVENYLKDISKLDQVFNSSRAHLRDWSASSKLNYESDELQKNAEQVIIHGNEILRLAWAGEQAAIQSYINSYEEKLSTLNVSFDVFKTKLTANKQTFLKSLNSKLSNTHNLQIWSFVFIFLLLVAGAVLNWNALEHLLKLSFSRWEYADYKQEEKIQELNAFLLDLTKNLEEAAELNALVKKNWNEGFSLLPKSFELSSKLEALAKSTEQRWPVLIKEQSQVKESLEKALIDIARIKEEAQLKLAETDRRLDLDLSHFKEYSEIIDKHLAAIVEQKSSYTLLSSSLSQIKKAWSLSRSSIDDTSNRMSLIINESKKMSQSIKAMQDECKKTESFRRSLEMGSGEEIATNFKDSVYIQEASHLEPGDEASGSLNSIIEYSLEEQVDTTENHSSDENEFSENKVA